MNIFSVEKKEKVSEKEKISEKENFIGIEGLSWNLMSSYRLLNIKFTLHLLR